MAIRKNKKRIDPRYFLHETTYRDLEMLAEAPTPQERKDVRRQVARKYKDGDVINQEQYEEIVALGRQHGWDEVTAEMSAPATRTRDGKWVIDL
jgi:hypothetical protein